MPLKLTKVAQKAPTAPTAEVSKVITESGKTLSEENTMEQPELGVPKVKEALPHCVVGFSAGYTHNLGNFQSARVDVMLLVPCQHGEIEQVYGYAEKWVNDKVQQLITDLQG